jgi:signal transduction histidine kinase/streptogramin lyase
MCVTNNRTTSGRQHPVSTAHVFVVFLAVASAAFGYQPKHADPLLESYRWHHIPELTEKGFYCMAEVPDGTMWFGVEDGVTSYDGTQWKSSQLVANHRAPVLSICAAADNTIFAADNRTVWRSTGDSWQCLFEAPAVPNWGINKLTWTADGGLWVGTNHGILRIQNGNIHTYGPEKCLTALRNASWEGLLHNVPGLKSPDQMFPAYNIESAGPGKVLVRARDAVYLFAHDGRDTVAVSWQELSDLKKNWYPIRSTVVCQAADGAIWALGDNGQVVRIGGGKTESWDLRKLVNGDVTVSIAEGHDGSIWVGGQGSLFVFSDNAWRAYAQPVIPSGGAARITVVPASDGTVWIASEQNDVYRVDYSQQRWLTLEDLNFCVETPDGRSWFLDKAGHAVSADQHLADWRRYGPDDGLIDAPVTLYVTRDKQLWAVGGNDLEAAVSWFDGSRWHSKTFPGMCWSFDYRSVFEARDGRVWFGATANALAEKDQRGGILRFDPLLGKPADDRAWQRYKLPAARTSTYGIGETADGTMWFGGVNLLAYNAETGRSIEDVSRPFPPSARIDNIHTTADHRLWVATRNYGVASFDGKTWNRFDASNGLLHNTTIAALELANGDVLLSTDRDTSRYDGISWTNQALPTNFNLQREGGEFRQTSNGSIWISISSRGWKRRAHDHDIYDPAKQQFWTCRYVPERQTPATKITLHESEVSSRGNTIIAWTGADRWHVTACDELRYSYRFDDGAWSHYTADTQRVFTSLKSGAHSFEVRARDMDFNVDPTPQKIYFHVAPPLWQQPWFAALLGLLTVAVVIGIRSYNVHRWNSALREVNIQLGNRVSERTAELEDTNRELEAFAHSVSHDLRAPLRAMEGFAIALEEDYGEKLDDQGREFVRHIADSANRMDTLIRDLLEYSRLGREELPMQPNDLKEVVRVALGELAAEVVATEADISVADRLPTVNGHRATLVCVATNLISNALKFVRPQTRPVVRIWTEPAGCGKIRLLVEDHGIGIEERHQQRIFRMFERLHGVESFPGTGVGLAVVARACERLGGSCGVDSIPGQGSRFWVELPESG